MPGADLFASKRFSKKQGEIFRWYWDQRQRKLDGDTDYEHILSSAWGRRCGKSDGHSALFAQILVDELVDRAAKIRRGELRPWSGIGKSRTRQKREKPHFMAFVVGPSQRDLVDVSGFILQAFSGQGSIYLHPDERMQIIDNGSRMMLLHKGACAVVSFIPAKHASSMVGRGPQIVYLTESGFIPSMHWDRLLPSFWDLRTWVLCEGTPSQDPQHWFTRTLNSGLDEEDPEFDPDISRRNPRVHTTRASTITDAYLATAREAAKQEAEYRGERWKKIWIDASWTAGSDAVFDQWNADRSVVRVIERRSRWRIGTHSDIRRPDAIEIYVDWHKGAAPGACVCLAIWRGKNPIDPEDPRPVVVQLDEHQDDDDRLEYDRLGWWRVIREMRSKWGARTIYGDPTGRKLMDQARRFGLRIKPADNAEKLTRLEILNSLMFVPREGHPAFYISEDCQKTARKVGTYYYKRDYSGELTDKPTQYDDHLTDCLAYAAGHHARGPGGRIL